MEATKATSNIQVQEELNQSKTNSQNEIKKH